MRGVILLVVLTSACGACGHKPPADASTAPEPLSSKEPDSKWEGASTEDLKARAAPGPGAGAASPAPTGAPAHRTDAYDKEQTEISLKRAARQVKTNCGQAKDDSGKATGPWGKVNMAIVLAPNGHSKSATIPAPYDGKAVGRCAVQAFTNLVFPPWAGSETTVEWEVEIVQPTGEAGK